MDFALEALFRRQEDNDELDTDEALSPNEQANNQNPDVENWQLTQVDEQAPSDSSETEAGVPVETAIIVIVVVVLLCLAICCFIRWYSGKNKNSDSTPNSPMTSPLTSPTLGGVGAGLGAMAGGIGSMMGGAKDKAQSGFGNVTGSMQNLLGGAKSNVQGGLQGAHGGLQNIMGGAQGGLQNIMGGAQGGFQNMMGNAQGGVQNMMGQFQNQAMSEKQNLISNTTQKATGMLRDNVQNAQHFIGDTLVERTLGQGASQGMLGKTLSDNFGRQATEQLAGKVFGGQQNVPSYLQEAMAPPPPKDAQGFLSNALGQFTGGGGGQSPLQGMFGGGGQQSPLQGMFGGGQGQQSPLQQGMAAFNIMGGGNQQPQYQQQTHQQNMFSNFTLPKF